MPTANVNRKRRFARLATFAVLAPIAAVIAFGPGAPAADPSGHTGTNTASGTLTW